MMVYQNDIKLATHHHQLLPSPMWAEGTVLSLCVCVLPQNCCKLQLNKLQVINLRQKVVLYKTGKFLEASMAQVALIWKQEKLNVQILHERLLNQCKGNILLET